MSPGGMANFDPRGMVGRIYEGDYLTLLNTKYLSSGPHGFREEDWASWFQRRFFKFFPLCLWELMSPGAWPIWTPGTWLAKFM